jgi:hypothetical protein
MPEGQAPSLGKGRIGKVGYTLFSMSPTPTLDLELEPPKEARNWSKWLIGLPMGGVLGLYVIGAMQGSPLDFFLWIFALYVAIAIHELGHLVAGSLAGMPPGGVVVGGFCFFKSGDHWTFRFDRRYILGGVAKPLPASGEVRINRFAWMIAGGPIASLVLALACAWASLALGDSVWYWIDGLLSASLLILFFSLVPFSGGINKSDGARLWFLLRREEQSRPWIALLGLQTEDANGVVPRNWDSQLVTGALMTKPNQGEYAYAQLLALYRFADLEDELTALVHLENALSSPPRAKPLQQAIFLEAASVSAITRKNPGQARIWLDRALKLGKPPSAESTRAAIAMSEGRYADAISHFGAARSFMERRKLDSGLARFAKERIAVMEGECRAALEKQTDFQNAGLR